MENKKLISLKNKKILVTGGAGFIGSAVVRYLNDRGMSNIVVVDRIIHMPDPIIVRLSIYLCCGIYPV